MGIAMGAGSRPARRRSAGPIGEPVLGAAMLAEGRRVINSVERAANLFIHGTVYCSACMAVVIAVVGTDYRSCPAT